MSGEIQLNGQAATVLQHRQKNKYTYRRQLSEFNGKASSPGRYKFSNFMRKKE